MNVSTGIEYTQDLAMANFPLRYRGFIAKQNSNAKSCYVYSGLYPSIIKKGGIDMSTEKNRPSHNIHVKVYKGVESRIGSQVGVGFAHKEGEGINIILDAIPIANANGQLELIAFPVTTE